MKVYDHQPRLAEDKTNVRCVSCDNSEMKTGEAVACLRANIIAIQKGDYTVEPSDVAAMKATFELIAKQIPLNQIALFNGFFASQGQ